MNASWSIEQKVEALERALLGVLSVLETKMMSTKEQRTMAVYFIRKALELPEPSEIEE